MYSRLDYSRTLSDAAPLDGDKDETRDGNGVCKRPAQRTTQERRELTRYVE